MYIYIVPLRQAYSEDLMIAHGSVEHATNGTCYVSWLLTTASSACVVGGECCKGARIDEGAGGLATLQYKTPDPHLALQQLPSPCLVAWKTSLKHTRSRLIVSHNHSHVVMALPAKTRMKNKMVGKLGNVAELSI